jgi:serine/threonine protein kinase
MSSRFSNPAPTPIPDHELVQRIGGGRYGETWLALSVTEAWRAVRIVHRGGFDSDRSYARELDEILKFEPISRTHPGLVSILHVGQDQAAACFYYVMEVADDLDRGQAIDPVHYIPRTLEALLRHGPLAVADSVELALALTDSVRHVHEHGLVHRDIQPANILFIDELPKLAVIGLVSGSARGAISEGAQGLIPPEGFVRAPADLFSLGKVIDQMITGLAGDRFSEPPDPSPRQVDPVRSALLDAVILKACEPEATRRFTSAADLEEALRAVQRGVPLPPDQPAPRLVPVGQRVVILFTPDDPRDLRLACLLAERLRGEQFSVFLDDRAGFGVKWARRMEAEIREADVVLLLISDGSVGDAVFHYQVDVAMQTQRLAPGVVTVPLGIGLTLPLPAALEGAFAAESWLGWSADTGDEELCLAVLRALGSDLKS